MKKTAIGLLALTLFFPSLSFCQSTTQPPSSWLTFQEQERAKRVAFFQQMNADRETFLQQHPDVKAYLDQMRAEGQARAAAWRASHQHKLPGQ